MASVKEIAQQDSVRKKMMCAARQFHNSYRLVRKMAVKLILLGEVVDVELFDQADDVADDFLSQHYITDTGRLDVD